MTGSSVIVYCTARTEKIVISYSFRPSKGLLLRYMIIYLKELLSPPLRALAFISADQIGRRSSVSVPFVPSGTAQVGMFFGITKKYFIFLTYPLSTYPVNRTPSLAEWCKGRNFNNTLQQFSSFFGPTKRKTLEDCKIFFTFLPLLHRQKEFVQKVY